MIFSLLLLQSASPLSNLGGLLPILAMVAIFYFLVFLPMRKQQRATKEMIKALQNGQTVVTSGGIIGTIIAVNDDTLILRIKPDNLKLQVSRSAVTSVVNTDEAVKKTS
jgi:preprotein translocase subunit YajC